jgi:hypothetical protein
MIVLPRADALPIFLPLIQGLVERENARGDCMDATKLYTILLSGSRQLVCVYKNENELVPLIMLVLGVTEESTRKRVTVVVDNILVPDPERLKGHDFKDDISGFLGLCKDADRIVFNTDNQDMLAFVKRLVPNLNFRPTTILYEAKLEVNLGR